MTRNLSYFVFILYIICLPAEARMYQWTDSDTGTTQLSGKPPAWYRSGERGPRIFVFESGQLVDDTGIKVSEEQRQLLRQRSFDIANEESIRDKAKSILSKRDKRIEEEEPLEEEVLDEATDVEDVAESSTDDEGAKTPEDLSGLSIDDMRQLILDWEEVQKQKAKEIINQ